MPTCPNEWRYQQRFLFLSGKQPCPGGNAFLFLYHACQAGLDMGIVNAGMLGVYDEIEAKLRDRVEAVILNANPEAGEELLAYAESIKDQNENRKQSGADLAWRKSPLPKD